MEVPNYLIDLKLKKGKHYPAEFINLLGFFQNRKAFISIRDPILDTHLEAEKNLIERTFLDFFLKQRNSKVVSRCVQRINRKLKNVNPQIERDPDTRRYFLTMPYNTAIDSKKHREYLRQPELYYCFAWAWLAKVIDGVNPNLVHRCIACKKIFISKQKKKYHPECRGPYLSKKFSRKYVESGKAKMKQKAYRQRLRAKKAIAAK
jgi:hypothetical protein